MKASTRLRELLSRIVAAPGAYDGLSARLREAAGFDAVYASGGAIARAAGYPDIGLLSFSEVMDRVEKIVDAGGLPVVADADTGFGGSANVERTVRAMERAGVAAFHIEDQSFPKRCGHLDDKSLIDAGKCAARSASRARRCPTTTRWSSRAPTPSLWKVSMPPSRAPNAISRPAPT